MAINKGNWLLSAGKLQRGAGRNKTKRTSKAIEM